MAVSTKVRASVAREGEEGFIDLLPMVAGTGGEDGGDGFSGGFVFVGGLEGGSGVGVGRSVCTTKARTMTAVLKAMRASFCIALSRMLRKGQRWRWRRRVAQRLEKRENTRDG